MEIQEDFAELFELLNRNNVKYIVVGGYALAFHGAPRYTGDIDVFVKPEKKNAQNIMQALDDFGFGDLEVCAKDFSVPNMVVQLGVQPVRVDFITSLSGVDWQSAEEGMVRGSYGQVPVNFLGKKELLRNKRATAGIRTLPTSKPSSKMQRGNYMPNERVATLATIIVISTGALWGFYWLPVRRLAEIALPGAWSTLAIVAAATLLLTPLVIRRRRQLFGADPVGSVSVALGGTAFMFYSVSFAYGRVAIVILLFFLTPVWSTLIGRYIMGWKTTRLRLAAIAIGFAGLAVMLGADGQIPIPQTTGEWLGLISGILWSIATTGMRSRSNLGPVEAAFVFAAGASVGALVLAPFLEPWPSHIAFESIGKIFGWAIVTGGIWWAFSTASLMWATRRLEPARVGILLMTEVLVGAISAALIAHEHMVGLEILGGALVLLAGIFEVWSIKEFKGKESSGPS